MRIIRMSGLLPLAVLAACATPSPPASPPTFACVQEGVASWYRPTAGRGHTADGEHPSAAELTAAHTSLPFGTRVRVTDIASGRSVTVRISDRGPFARDRIIDLSASAANVLGMRREGTAQVRLELEQPGSDTVAGCPFAHTTES